MPIGLVHTTRIVLKMCVFFSLFLRGVLCSLFCPTKTFVLLKNDNYPQKHDLQASLCSASVLVGTSASVAPSFSKIHSKPSYQGIPSTRNRHNWGPCRNWTHRHGEKGIPYWPVYTSYIRSGGSGHKVGGGDGIGTHSIPIP